MVQAAVAERKKKDRSPSYPAIDLETALERARQLLSKRGPPLCADQRDTSALGIRH